MKLPVLLDKFSFLNLSPPNFQTTQNNDSKLNFPFFSIHFYWLCQELKESRSFVRPVQSLGLFHISLTSLLGLSHFSLTSLPRLSKLSKLSNLLNLIRIDGA